MGRKSIMRKKGHELLKRLDHVTELLQGLPNAIDNNQCLLEVCEILGEVIITTHYLDTNNENAIEEIMKTVD
jgi:hypothetical protein